MNDEGIPSYSFSKITDKKLSELVDIKQSIDSNIFDDWFAFEVDFSDELISFLTSLIDKNRFLIKKYNKLFQNLVWIVTREIFVGDCRPTKEAYKLQRLQHFRSLVRVVYQTHIYLHS